MNKDINSFEYFEEMTTDWSRLDLLRRCYDLCNEMVEKQKKIERLNNIINEAIKKLNKYRNRKDTWGLWCMEYGDNAEIIKILGGEVKNE